MPLNRIKYINDGSKKAVQIPVIHRINHKTAHEDK